MPLKTRKPVPIPRISSRPSWLSLPTEKAVAPIAIPYHEQQADNWCWAACAQMLQEGLHKPVWTQCRMARQLLTKTQVPGPVNCCVRPVPSPCDVGCLPEDIYSDLGIGMVGQAGALSPEDLDRELAARRPVLAYWLWDLGGAHVVLIIGRNALGDYLVHNPLTGSGPARYADLASAAGQGTWAYSYVDIR